MEVFKLSGFVEDKNLAKVKRLLAGLVYELKDEPVINAQTTNGKVHYINENGVIGIALKGLKPGNTFSAKEMQTKLVAAGYSRSRIYKLLSDLIKAKIIQRVTRGQYKLTNKQIRQVKSKA